MDDLKRRRKTTSPIWPPPMKQMGYVVDRKYSKIPSAKTNTLTDSGRVPNWNIAIALFVVALMIRLFNIHHPHYVVFDEVHFGGFSTKYINGEFFMDVHPPLGKLLFAGAGYFSGGFNSTFYFKKIGTDYIENHVPYVTMRLVPGVLGAALVPVSYITCRNLGLRELSAILVAGLVLFENGLATQTRLILLDSALIFFTALTVMFWTQFMTTQEKPFTERWWISLFMAGFSLGLACSVKWVGLFLIATIGLSTLQNLWLILGDVKNVTPIKFAKHFAARAVCLIVVPCALYAFFFLVHFWALPLKGTGASFMSPEFQTSLKGVGLKEAYVDVMYGSTISLRHQATSCGYLHSHPHDYPTGSKQQQVTCYAFDDTNGHFLIEKAFRSVNGKSVTDPVNSTEYLKDGDVVRLMHVITNRRLHSHDVRAPLTTSEHHNEVSAYGSEKTTDSNDFWRIEVVNPAGRDTRVKAIHSKIKLVHVNRHCSLFAQKNKKLPDWGYSQQEVTCAKNGNRPGAIWRIESNQNPFLPANAEKVKYKRPGFWSRFFELNRRMWEINQGLTGSHPYESRPKDWPFLRRGISFWQSSSGQPGQIYLLGNPIVWWTSTVCVLASALLLGVGMLLVKRNINVLTEALVIRAWNMAQLVVSGWLLHYFPFHLMHRQLFLHHYFPALYFAILSIGLIFDLVTYKMAQRFRLIAVGIILGVVFLVFLDFSPLAYGHTMHRHHCERLKWRKDWDWTCLRSPLEEHDILAEIGGKFLNHAADASPVVYSPNPSAVLDAVARIARIEAALHSNSTSPVTGEVSPSR